MLLLGLLWSSYVNQKAEDSCLVLSVGHTCSHEADEFFLQTGAGLTTPRISQPKEAMEELTGMGSGHSVQQAEGKLGLAGSGASTSGLSLGWLERK